MNELEKIAYDKGVLNGTIILLTTLKEFMIKNNQNDFIGVCDSGDNDLSLRQIMDCLETISTLRKDIEFIEYETKSSILSKIMRNIL